MRKLKYVKLFENFESEIPSDNRIVVPIYEVEDGKPTKNEKSKFRYSKSDDFQHINRIKENHPIIKNLSYKKDIQSIEMFQSYSGNVFIFRTFDNRGIPNEYDIKNEVLKGWFIGSDYLDNTKFTIIEEKIKGCIYESDLEKCSIKDINDISVVFRQLGYWVVGN